jgi:hypothetical protein
MKVLHGWPRTYSSSTILTDCLNKTDSVPVQYSKLLLVLVSTVVLGFRPQCQKLCYDKRSVGQCVLVSSTPLEPKEKKNVLLSDSCGFVDVGRPLWQRGRVCPLQLLLALASAVMFRSEFCGTHHVLLSQIRDSPNLEGQVPPYLYPPGTGWSGYTPRHRLPVSSPPTTRRATVEVFEPASTRALLSSLCLELTENTAFKNSRIVLCLFVFVHLALTPTPFCSVFISCVHINAKERTEPGFLFWPLLYSFYVNHRAHVPNRNFNMTIRNRKTTLYPILRLVCYVRTDVGTERQNEVIKNIVFWDVTPCSLLKVAPRFGGTYRLHLQVWRLRQARNQREIMSKIVFSTWFHPGFLSYSSNLKVEAIYSTEASVDFTADYTALYPAVRISDPTGRT